MSGEYNTRVTKCAREAITNINADVIALTSDDFRLRLNGDIIGHAAGLMSTLIGVLLEAHAHTPATIKAATDKAIRVHGDLLAERSGAKRKHRDAETVEDVAPPAKVAKGSAPAAAAAVAAVLLWSNNEGGPPDMYVLTPAECTPKMVAALELAHNKDVMEDEGESDELDSAFKRITKFCEARKDQLADSVPVQCPPNAKIYHVSCSV